MAYRYKKLTAEDFKNTIGNRRGFPRKVYLDDYHYVYELPDGTLINEEMLNSIHNEITKELEYNVATC